MGAEQGMVAQVEAVTRGVRVTAAVVYMPDDPLQAGGQYLFAYRSAPFLL